MLLSIPTIKIYKRQLENNPTVQGLADSTIFVLELLDCIFTKQALKDE